MKWLLACLTLFCMVAPAMAGEDPYVAIVDNDLSATGWNFYFNLRQQQFVLDQESLGVPVAGEQFRSQTASTRREVCDVTGQAVTLPNAKTPAGNAGFYEWWIRLPKKPSGEINIVIECGVLKPGGTSIELCAAETGERVGAGTCVRQEVDPGVSPVSYTALPRIGAVVYPGPFNAFTPFHLTAFKNPSSYTLAFDPVTAAMSNNVNSQVLDGSTNARILLKACMDKTIVTKLPVTGQVNALGETENDLEAGDMIQVRLDVPRQNSVDVYCHRWSTRLMGVGEGSF
ncbi:MAG TPA: hypothetical protein VMT71_05690 [Syntrophorhabdales bacterium]|nr:hypothetical protein [Syntrophorhabdales bacterium]